MPAPLPPALLGLAMTKLSDNDPTQYLEFLTTLTGDIATAWLQWQLGITGGKNTVAGAGVGAWAGVGGGGNLSASGKFTINHTWTKDDENNTFAELKKAITAEFKEQFSGYIDSFVFGPVNYVGFTTATPITPGTFTAFAIPMPLIATKASGNAPSGIASGIRDRLPSDWDTDSPLDAFLEAIEFSVSKNFLIWEATSMFIGDSVNGSAAPAGVGAGSSGGSGMIV